MTGGSGIGRAIAVLLKLSRQEQDALDARSDARAVAAQRKGCFRDEIVPIKVKTRKAEIEFDADEHPRTDTTVAILASLRPVVGKSDPEATVTAGSASGQHDAAAACIVTTRGRAEQLGIAPPGRLVTWASAGVEPSRALGLYWRPIVPSIVQG